MKKHISGKTDIGLKRKLNEDCFLIRPDLGLYIIADGMGGHRAGEVASRMVIDTMMEYWEKVRADMAPSFLQPIREDISLVANHLINSIAFSNIVVHEAQKRPEYHRMGSTVSVIVEDEETLWAANVGDSPIYLFDHGNLILVSEEHSVEAEQKNLGLFNASSSTNPVIKNMLTRVMGLNESVDVHITPIKPALNDIVVICSDGLTNYLSPISIKTILDDYTLSLDRKTTLLIDEANLGGGGDNVTVILIEIMEEQGRWKKFTRKFFGNE
jgi:protein phosphatase